MTRGTFANIRIRNLLVPGVEGGVTQYLPTGEQMSVFDAAVKYPATSTPLVVLAGSMAPVRRATGPQRERPAGNSRGDRDQL